MSMLKSQQKAKQKSTPVLEPRELHRATLADTHLLQQKLRSRPQKPVQGGKTQSVTDKWLVVGMLLVDKREG